MERRAGITSRILERLPFKKKQTEQTEEERVRKEFSEIKDGLG